MQTEDGDNETELTGEFPEYQDTKHSEVAKSATRALRAALENSREHAVQVQDFWDVFQNFIRRYEYGGFIDTLVGEIESDLKDAVRQEKSDELTEEIRKELKVQIRIESQPLILQQVEDELRESIEEQVRTKLIRDVEPLLRRELRALITEEIRPEVEVKLRGELMTDPEFIASVKAELQRKILGL